MGDAELEQKERYEERIQELKVRIRQKEDQKQTEAEATEYINIGKAIEMPWMRAMKLIPNLEEENEINSSVSSAWNSVVIAL